MFARLSMILIAVAARASDAQGAPKTCPLKSQEIKLARECFSGDMRLTDDFGTFIGTDETSKDDMNYCYNAFVLVHPKKGTDLQFSVWKDNPKGKLQIFNYVVMEQTVFGKSQPRGPASRTPVPVAFKNLKGECFANRVETDKCSKGVFGFGSSDIPMTVELARGRSGFTVKGHTKDKKAIETADDYALEPKSLGDQNQTDAWLVQVVKQRLVTTAQRKLAMIAGHRLSEKSLGQATSQFRYCRMALDGFLHQKKIPDPFNEQEKKTLDSLEGHLKGTAPTTSKPKKK